jgi:hypothetical protein
MKAIYRISVKEFGTIFLKKRRIAKAFRWWLRENNIPFQYSYSFNEIRLWD